MSVNGLLQFYENWRYDVRILESIFAKALQKHVTVYCETVTVFLERFSEWGEFVYQNLLTLWIKRPTLWSAIKKNDIIYQKRSIKNSFWAWFNFFFYIFPLKGRQLFCLIAKLRWLHIIIYTNYHYESQLKKKKK